MKMLPFKPTKMKIKISNSDADKDRIKAACTKFAERLAKKSKPEKSLWHLVTMAICSGNCTGAAVADFASKIGNDEAIDFIKKLHSTK